MATKNIRGRSGFTIIEVVLVLAVAGLIFLMVFIALPALQRSQRDTQRRQAVSQLSASVTQYQTNNSTKNDNLPGSATTTNCKFKAEDFTYASADEGGGSSGPSNDACKFVQQYLNPSATAKDLLQTTFVDPDGVAYNLSIQQLATGTEFSTSSFDHTMYIIRRAQCEGEKAVSANVRQYAVLYKLEGAGTVCLDNS